MHRLVSRRLGALLLGALALAPGPAFAQSIERNLPPAPSIGAPALPTPQEAPQEAPKPQDDDTPIGPALRGIVTLSGSGAVLSAAHDGVDLSRTPRLAGASPQLSAFLGRRLSRKLISQIETELVKRYRAKGYPFVSVSTPAQEVTSGVLQIRVVEFHLGAKTVPGASLKDASYIESRVRLRPGEPIDPAALGQDIDWLNRFPFRKIEAVFTPGTALGLTDLHLQTTPLKPWSVYVGYSDSGSPLTGVDRYFAGAQTVLPILHDALVSYQFTGSNDVLFDADRLFMTAPDPRYISQAGRLIVPTLPRQAIEASLSYVQSNEPVQDFLVRATTYEATLDYRSALSNLWAPLPGEIAVGVEAKRQTSRTLFGGVDVLDSSFDVFQLTLAYAQQEVDLFGRTSGDLTLHVSPGAVDHRNTAEALSIYSGGNSNQVNYTYVSIDLSRYTQLPPLYGISGFGLTNSLIGQYSAIALPLTEKLGLGNNGLVRGYTLDDGAFDTGLISRNELRLPTFPVFGRRLADQLSPYLFVDAGYGKDRRTKADASPVSTGLGADYQLGAHLSVSLDGAWALKPMGLTAGGDLRVESRVTITF